MRLGSVIHTERRAIEDILFALRNRLTAEDNLAPDGVEGQVLTSRGPNLPPSWQDPNETPGSDGVDGTGTPGRLAMWLDTHTLTDAPVAFDGGVLDVLVDAQFESGINVLGNSILGDSDTDTINPIARFINHLIPRLVVVDTVHAVIVSVDGNPAGGYKTTSVGYSFPDLDLSGTFKFEELTGIFGAIFTDFRIQVRSQSGSVDPFNSTGEYNFFRIISNGDGSWQVWFYYNPSGGPPVVLGSGIYSPNPGVPDTSTHTWRVVLDGVNFSLFIDGVGAMDGFFVDGPGSPLLLAGPVRISMTQDLHYGPTGYWSSASTASITELGEVVPTYDIGTEDIWWRRGYFGDLSVNGIDYEWPSEITPGFVLMTDINGNLRWGKVRASDVDGLHSPSDGIEGPEGPMGPMGASGLRGLQGLQGTVGNEGTEGPEGALGPVGPKGDKGDKGDIGLAGRDGEDGVDGVSGTTGAAGADGATGPAGSPGLPGVDGEDGADGVQGPSGPAGSPGATGSTGPAGTPGMAGLDGDDGTDGVAGPTGPVGPQGIQGFIGLAGEDGNDGVDGLTGPQGPIGLTGSIGPAGFDGLDGDQGPTGPPGPTGDTGANGADGLTGPAGPAGRTGDDGIDGMDGYPGAPGPVGPTGVAGSTGPAGSSGQPGADGEDGALLVGALPGVTQSYILARGLGA